jgi:hypothetical protein
VFVERGGEGTTGGGEQRLEMISVYPDDDRPPGEIVGEGEVVLRTEMVVKYEGLFR